MNVRADRLDRAIDETLEDPDGGALVIHADGCDHDCRPEEAVCPCGSRVVIVPPARVSRVLTWLAWAVKRGHL